MSYKVELTDTAKQDLKDIAFYIADSSKDINIAKNFVAELKNKVRSLEDFPNAGALPKDRNLRSFGYRFLSYKDYLLFYLTNEQEKKVTVMAIFNGKKDYMQVMKKYV